MLGYLRITKGYLRLIKGEPRGVAGEATPPRNDLYEFAGHACAFSGSGGRNQLLAGHASGGICWHFNHRLPHDHPRWKGMCGLLRPSKAHLTWNCPATADLRFGHRLPVNRAEERLFASAIGEFPPATPAVDLSDFVEALRDCLIEAMMIFLCRP